VRTSSRDHGQNATEIKMQHLFSIKTGYKLNVTVIKYKYIPQVKIIDRRRSYLSGDQF